MPVSEREGESPTNPFPEGLYQGSVRRAGTELRGATNYWWRFRIPAALLTAGFAVWGALLPAKASPAERVALAAGGSVGGALLVSAAAFVVLLTSAPIRQRNELRNIVEQLTDVARNEADHPVHAIDRAITQGEQLLARADDPSWPSFQRDHAYTEWEPRARSVIRDLAPRYYYWYSELAPEYGVGPPVGPRLSPQASFRLQIQGRLKQLRDIRDRLLAQRIGGHPDGPKRTTYLLLADVLMDARGALSRLMAQGDLRGLENWDSHYRQLCDEAFARGHVDYLFENGFRSERWGAQGDVDEQSMKRYMERSIRLGEFVHVLGEQALNPGFSIGRWLAVF